MSVLLYAAAKSGGLFDPKAKVTFVRCPGCGRDGRFQLNGKDVFNVRTFEDAVLVYDMVIHYGDPDDPQTLRRQAVAESTWLHGHFPQAASPIFATPGEMIPFSDTHVPDSELDQFLRFGGDNR